MKTIVAEDYKIEVMKAPDDQGGYLAYIPQLDCWGDGETSMEAMKEVIEVAQDMIDIALEEGMKLPIPNTYKPEDEYSGKLLVRLPKYLHSMVAKTAEEENCSINQLIQSYIAIGIGKNFGEKTINIHIEKEKENINNVQESVLKNNEWTNTMFNKLDKKFFQK